MSFDIEFVRGAQQLVLSTPWMSVFVVFLARWLILFEILIAVGFLFSKNRHKHLAAIEAAWATGLSLVFTSLLSRLVLRPRPFLAQSDITLLIPPPFNTSLPSGHTGFAIALACVLFSVDRTMGYVAFAMAAFIAFGRIAVGVHYPTDILAGVCVGVVSFGCIRLITRALAAKDLARAAARTHHS